MKSSRFKQTIRVISCIVVLAFTTHALIPPQVCYAQTLPQLLGINIPAPGSFVPLSDPYQPAVIKGITIHPQNPLEFEFIVHPGDDHLQEEIFKKECTKLIKYFMAALTVPENQMWVNLSPYEKDRIIPTSFGETEMGRDLLAQDYLLKQLTASLMYPENDLGKNFWNRVYKKAKDQYGTTDIPIETFNKIWIIPEKAVLYENGKSVFVVESRLKVLLEEDYLAIRHQTSGIRDQESDVRHKNLTAENKNLTAVLRDILIPEIEREVNEGKNFANLRQIYNSVILATWYKQNLKQSFLSKVYVDKSKTKGIDLEDKKISQKIYQQYLKAFQKGVYEFIKEEYDPAQKEIIPRKYFSGGMDYAMVAESIEVIPSSGKLVQDLIGTQKIHMRFGQIPREEEAMAQGDIELIKPLLKRIKAAVFDWDDTIQGGAHIFRDEGENALFAEMIYKDQTISAEEREAIDTLVEEYNRDNISPGMKKIQWVFDQRKRLFPKATPLNLTEFFEHYDNRMTELYLTNHHRFAPKEGIVPLIQNLKSSEIILSIATNHREKIKKVQARDVGLSPFVPDENIFGSDSVIFQGQKYNKTLVCKKIQTDNQLLPQEVALFEDSAPAIRLAVKNGFVGIGIARDENHAMELKQAGAHMIVYQDYRHHDEILNQLISMDAKPRILTASEKEILKKLIESNDRQFSPLTRAKPGGLTEPAKGKVFKHSFRVTDPENPLHHFVVKVPDPSDILWHPEVLDSLKFCKRHMGEMTVPFTILEDVTFQGKKYPFIKVKESRLVYRNDLPHYFDADNGDTVDLWAQERELIHEAVRRNILLRDALISLNYGIDPQTGQLLFIDDMEPKEGQLETMFPEVTDMDFHLSSYPRQEPWHRKFHKGWSGFHFDQIGVLSDEKLYELWEKSQNEGLALPDKPVDDVMFPNMSDSMRTSEEAMDYSEKDLQEAFGTIERYISFQEQYSTIKKSATEHPWVVMDHYDDSIDMDKFYKKYNHYPQRIYNVDKNIHPDHLIDHSFKSAIFSDDGHYVLILTAGRNLELYDLIERDRVSLDFGRDEVDTSPFGWTNEIFSANKRYLVAKFRHEDYIGFARLYDLKSKQEIKTIDGREYQNIKLSQDASRMLVIFKDASVGLFDADTLKRIEIPFGNPIDGEFYEYWLGEKTMTMFYENSPSREFVLSTLEEIPYNPNPLERVRFTDNHHRWVDLKTYRELKDLIGGPFEQILLSPEGLVFVKYVGEPSKVFDFRTKKELKLDIDPEGIIDRVEISPDGKWLDLTYYTRQWNNETQSFDHSRHTTLVSLENPNDPKVKKLIGDDVKHVMISPLSRWVFVVYSDDTNKIFDLRTRQQLPAPLLDRRWEGVGFLYNDRFVQVQYKKVKETHLLDLKSYSENPVFTQAGEKWQESAPRAFHLLSQLVKDGIITNEEEFNKYYQFFYNAFEEFNSLTNDYNRWRIFDLFDEQKEDDEDEDWEIYPGILTYVHSRGGDIMQHFRFYLDIMKVNKGLALQTLEGVFEAIRLGIISIDTPGGILMAPHVIEFVKRTNGFNVELYRLYNDKGEKVYDMIRTIGQRILDDKVGPQELGRFVDSMNEMGYDGEEILYAVIQKVIPSSGASFVKKNEARGLLQKYREAGDRRGDVPEKLEKLGRFGRSQIQRIEWKLEEGKTFDENGNLKYLLDKLRYPDSGKSDDQIEKDRASDRAAFANALSLWLSDLENIENRDNVLSTFLSFASHDDQLREKVDRIQSEDYVSIDLLDQIFHDKYNLSSLFTKVLSQEFDLDGTDEIANRRLKSFRKALKGIWNSPEDMEVREEKLADLITKISNAELEKKILSQELDAGLQKALRKIMAKRQLSLTQTPEQLAEMIFTEPLRIIGNEKAKFEEIVSDDSIKISFRVVKEPASGMYGLCAGVCTASDVDLWKKKNFYLLEIIDETNEVVAGYVHLYEEMILGRRYLTIPGIEPSTEFLGQVKAREIYPMIEEALKIVARTEQFDEMVLPRNKYVISNRKDIVHLAQKKNYPEDTLPVSVEWNSLPEYYEQEFRKYWFDEVYVLWKKEMDGEADISGQRSDISDQVSEEAMATIAVDRKEMSEILSESDPDNKITKIKTFVEAQPPVLKAIHSSRENLNLLSTKPFYQIKVEGEDLFHFSLQMGEFFDFMGETPGPHRFQVLGETLSQEEFFNLTLTQPQGGTTTIKDLFVKRGLERVVEDGLPLERSLDFVYREESGNLDIIEEQTQNYGSNIELSFTKDGEFQSSGWGNSPLVTEVIQKVLPEYQDPLLLHTHFHPFEVIYPTLDDIEHILDSNTPGLIVTPLGQARLWAIKNKILLEEMRKSHHWENYKNLPFSATKDIVENLMTSIEVDLGVFVDQPPKKKYPEDQRFTDLNDKAIKLSKELASNKTADARDWLNLARQINPEFDSPLTDDQLKKIDPALFTVFQNALSFQICIPHNQLFEVPQVDEKPSAVQVQINGESWQALDYLKSKIWTAEIAEGDTDPQIGGIAPGWFAIVNPALRKKEGKKLYHRLKGYRLGMGIQSVFEQAIAQLIQNLDLSESVFIDKIILEAAWQEEIRHAQDDSYIAQKLRKDHRTDPRTMDLVIQEILKSPESMNQFANVLGSLKIDNSNKVLEHQMIQKAIMEYSGILGGIIGHMKKYIKEGREDLAFIAFLSFLNQQITATNSLITNVMGIPYLLVALQFFTDTNQQFGSALDYESFELIFRLQEGVDGFPAQEALDLLEDIYEKHFFTDGERLENLGDAEAFRLRGPKYTYEDDSMVAREFVIDWDSVEWLRKPQEKQKYKLWARFREILEKDDIIDQLGLNKTQLPEKASIEEFLYQGNFYTIRVDYKFGRIFIRQQKKNSQKELVVKAGFGIRQLVENYLIGDLPFKSTQGPITTNLKGLYHPRINELRKLARVLFGQSLPKWQKNMNLLYMQKNPLDRIAQINRLSADLSQALLVAALLGAEKTYDKIISSLLELIRDHLSEEKIPYAKLLAALGTMQHAVYYTRDTFAQRIQTYDYLFDKFSERMPESEKSLGQYHTTLAKASRLIWLASKEDLSEYHETKNKYFEATETLFSFERKTYREEVLALNLLAAAIAKDTPSYTKLKNRALEAIDAISKDKARVKSLSIVLYAMALMKDDDYTKTRSRFYDIINDVVHQFAKPTAIAFAILADDTYTKKVQDDESQASGEERETVEKHLLRFKQIIQEAIPRPLGTADIDLHPMLHDLDPFIEQLGQNPQWKIDQIPMGNHYLDLYPSKLLNIMRMIFNNDTSLSPLMDLRTVNYTLLSVPAVGHFMGLKNLINPHNNPIKGLNGASGMGLSEFLLSSNAAEGYFVDYDFTLKGDKMSRQNWTDQEKYKYEKYVQHFATSGDKGLWEISYFDALLVELEALGVSKKDIARIASLKEDFGKKKVTTIEFDWGYHNETPQKRIIHFVKGDMTDPASLEDIIPQNLDFYFQKAAYDMLSHSEKYLGWVISRLKKEAFLLIDPMIQSEEKDYVRLDPFDDIRAFGEVERLKNYESSFWEKYLLATFSPAGNYGKRLNAYKLTKKLTPDVDDESMISISHHSEIQHAWDQMVALHMNLTRFTEAFIGYTGRGKTLRSLDPETLDKIINSFDFQVDDETLRYYLSYIIYNTNLFSNRMFNINISLGKMSHYHIFLWNLLFSIALQRVGIHPKVLLDDPQFQTISSFNHEAEDEFAASILRPHSRFHSLSMQNLNFHLDITDAITPMQKKALWGEINHLIDEVFNKKFISFHTFAQRSDLPWSQTKPQSSFLPEYETVMPQKLLTSPREFIEQSDKIERVDIDNSLFEMFERSEPTSFIPLRFDGIFLPGEWRDKVKKFSVPIDGEPTTFYVKRINILRVRSPEEEIQLAEKIHRELQSINPRYHAQKYVGVIYDQGAFYLVSLGVDNARQIRPSHEAEAVALAATEEVLKRHGVHDATGLLREKEFLVNDQGIHVLDFETMPYHNIQSFWKTEDEAITAPAEKEESVEVNEDLKAVHQQIAQATVNMVEQIRQTGIRDVILSGRSGGAIIYSLLKETWNDPSDPLRFHYIPDDENKQLYKEQKAIPAIPPKRKIKSILAKVFNKPLKEIKKRSYIFVDDHSWSGWKRLAYREIFKMADIKTRFAYIAVQQGHPFTEDIYGTQAREVLSKVFQMTGGLGHQFPERDYSLTTEEYLDRYTGDPDLFTENVLQKHLASIQKEINKLQMDRQTPDEAMGQPEMPILERQSQTTSDEVGGIDMNPQLIDFTKEGSGFEFDWSLDTQDLPSGPIEGFIPIIINITPVTDIPLLLGIKNKTGQDNTLLELSQKN